MPLLAENADAEARQIAERETEVRTQVAFQRFEMVRRRKTPDEAFSILRAQRFGIQRRQGAMNAQHRRQPYGQVQVGRAFGDGQLQQVVHLDVSGSQRTH